MQYTYSDDQLTNYKPNKIELEKDEWLKLGQYSLRKKSNMFILKDDEGKVLSEYSDLLDGVLALIETEKGGKDEQ